MIALTKWKNFHVIVGLSAGALIGLLFVVLALIAEAPMAWRHAQAGARPSALLADGNFPITDTSGR